MRTMWAIPSWHGDIRFEAADGEGDRASGCRLVTAALTPLECETLRRWTKRAAGKKWLTLEAQERATDLAASANSGNFLVDAPLADAAALMASLLGYKAAGQLTCFRFTDGRVEATEIVEPEGLARWAKKLLGKKPEAPPPPPEPCVLVTSTRRMVERDVPAHCVLPKGHKGRCRVREGAMPEGFVPVAAGTSDAAAATVHRPSLSCPECEGKPEADRMACDVLWAFLDEQQRREWTRDRAFTCFGGLTGHAYRIHPRDTAGAAVYGRVAFDLDDRVILHNFLRDVPPEEEALTVKLLLEHRENWLRVHGEVDPAHRASPGTIFDNPFAGRALLGI